MHQNNSGGPMQMLEILLEVQPVESGSWTACSFALGDVMRNVWQRCLWYFRFYTDPKTFYQVWRQSVGVAPWQIWATVKLRVSNFCLFSSHRHVGDMSGKPTSAKEKTGPVLRKGSSSKMALKSKIVQIYEAFFRVSVVKMSQHTQNTTSR